MGNIFTQILVSLFSEIRLDFSWFSQLFRDSGSQLSRKDKQRLECFIRSGRKSFKLLYSFEYDGANATTFHQKCDNKGPTLIVIYNTQGSVYGGYTAQSWCQSDRFVQDSDAFLYRLKLDGKSSPMKFPVKTMEKAIYCGKNYGPIFGGGHDLYTFIGSLNASNNVFTLNGGTNFGNSYDMQGISVDQITNNIPTVNNLEVYLVTGRENYLMEENWRNYDSWELKDLHDFKEEIEIYSPPRGFVSNILFLGPVGAGKSSFFNSVLSVLRRQGTMQANAGSAEQSVTSKYSMYKIRPTSNSDPLKFRLCDTRGLEEVQCLDVEELVYLLDGHVPDGYQFNPSVPVSKDIQGFIKYPKNSDKIHCVCFIFDGSTVTVMPENLLEKMKTLQMKIRQKGITQVILLTKIDKVCSFVEKDVKKVFRSEAICELVDIVSEMFGVPRNCVLPVKNYEKEVDLDKDISILLLLSLRQILRSATDYLYNFLDDENDGGDTDA